VLLILLREVLHYKEMYRSLLLLSFIDLFIRPLIYSLQSVLRQVHCLFQSNLSTKYDVGFYLSIFNIPSLPESHSVAAYLFSLVFLSIPPFPLSLNRMLCTVVTTHCVTNAVIFLFSLYLRFSFPP
jgi:hypothetical protein